MIIAKRKKMKKDEKECDKMEKDESLDNSDSDHQYKVTFLKWRNNFL